LQTGLIKNYEKIMKRIENVGRNEIYVEKSK